MKKPSLHHTTPPAPPMRGTEAMHAIVQRTYGSADVLHMEEVERPTIGENDVLIRVHAAGLDRGTWHFVTGILTLER